MNTLSLDDFTPLDVRPLHVGEHPLQVWRCQLRGCIRPPEELIAEDMRCPDCALASYLRLKAERSANRGRISGALVGRGPVGQLTAAPFDPLEVAIFALRELHGIDVEAGEDRP